MSDAEKLLSDDPRDAFWQGMRALVPLALGVAPFGMIYGVLALKSGITAAQAQSMSTIILAGSSQFILAELNHLRTPALVMIVTLFIVNLRHALYSASIAPYLARLSFGWKVLLSYLMTDEAYAVAITRYQNHPEHRNNHWFFLGAGIMLWIVWMGSTAAGLTLGAVIPEGWALDFTLPLTFIALVVPAIKSKASLTAAVVASAVGLALFALPFKLSIIAGTLAGIAAGMIIGRRT